MEWPKIQIWRLFWFLGYFGGRLATCWQFVPPHSKICGDAPVSTLIGIGFHSAPRWLRRNWVECWMHGRGLQCKCHWACTTIWKWHAIIVQNCYLFSTELIHSASGWGFANPDKAGGSGWHPFSVKGARTTGGGNIASTEAYICLNLIRMRAL